MKILISILFTAILALNISAQTKIVPVVDMRHSVLLGGVENGKWIKPDKVIPTLNTQTEFVIAGLKGVEEGGVTVGKKRGEEDVCDSDYQTFEFDLESENGIGIGSNAKWNFIPRVPREISTTSKEYTNTVSAFLKTNKITKSPVKISQAFRVDLDGDGTEEVILSATYYKKGIYEGQNAGDYSFVLLRKIIKGKVQNILISGEFFIKKGEYSPPNKYEITGIADLNGDSKMEIVVDSAYYEGATQTVYEIKGNKPAAVLEVGCGL